MNYYPKLEWPSLRRLFLLFCWRVFPIFAMLIGVVIRSLLLC